MTDASKPLDAWKAKTAHAFAEKPFVAWSIAVFGLCLLLGLFVDPWLTPWIKSLMSDDLSAYWRDITDFGRAGNYIIACIAVFAVCALVSFADKPHAKACRTGARNSLYILATLAVSGLAINLMKLVIGRQRPRALFDNDFYGLIPFNLDQAMNSFPSGHSQTIWAIAAPLMLLFPRLSPLCIAVGVLIALSRVILTVHFLSDAIAGAFVAIVTAILLKRFYLDDAKHDTVTGYPTPAIIRNWIAEFRERRPVMAVESGTAAQDETPGNGKKRRITIRRKNKSGAN
jgi:membrane-associated phospholipid phosphatase